MTLDIAQGLIRWETASGPDGQSRMQRITEPELAF